jgi:hypothetical protein
MNNVNNNATLMNNFQRSFNLQEILKRAIKYLIEGTAVAVAAFFIPKQQPKLEDVLMIAITAAATFALLDLYAPSVSAYARQGAGFGVGANLVGFPRK